MVNMLPIGLIIYGMSIIIGVLSETTSHPVPLMFLAIVGIIISSSIIGNNK